MIPKLKVRAKHSLPPPISALVSFPIEPVIENVPRDSRTSPKLPMHSRRCAGTSCYRVIEAYDKQYQGRI